jgi:Protein of unknown function (DUF3738)
MTTKTNFVVSLVLFLVGVPIFSQVRKPAFEVATVKPAIDDALPLIQVQRGGRFVSRNVPLFTALQDQLGLRLESAKAPVEVIVIDSVEKPSED